MRARLVVFPVKGRNWCFSRSIDPSASDSSSAQTPSTLKGLWTKISSKSNAQSLNANAELLVDFVSLKMNKAWNALEKAPQGNFKNKIYGVGLRLLSRVKSSEIFLQSISKDVTSVEILYPSSLNARLVRQRLRHVALRGTIIHKKYFYGSVSLLPLTTAFTVLPLPNIPFFWVLFRTYSHWRALKGSEKLLYLVSDGSYSSTKENKTEYDSTETAVSNHLGSTWVLQPSKELDEFLRYSDAPEGLSGVKISEICKTFDLNMNDILKYRDSM